MGDARVYADWVEARSFGCKKCGYLSTNQRVVEQHLRQSHPELFEVDSSPDPLPQGRGDPAGGVRNRSESSSFPKGKGAGEIGPIFYTDAGTWENGTRRQRSVLAVWDSRVERVVLHEELPGTTNNEAEYAAIIAALELAREERLAGPLIRSDSQLCVKQITGAYQVKEERLRPLRDRAARLLKHVDGRIEWVPRGRNHAGIFLETKYKR